MKYLTLNKKKLKLHFSFPPVYNKSINNNNYLNHKNETRHGTVRKGKKKHMYPIISVMSTHLKTCID
jgi:hypothetical protein